MLRQGMVVARHAVLLLVVKAWFDDVMYFSFDTVRVPVFHLSKNPRASAHVPWLGEALSMPPPS